jgi:hypothetical protein
MVFSKTLPLDALQEALSHLSGRTLTTRAMLTCKLWALLAADVQQQRPMLRSGAGVPSPPLPRPCPSLHHCMRPLLRASLSRWPSPVDSARAG